MRYILNLLVIAFVLAYVNTSFAKVGSHSSKGWFTIKVERVDGSTSLDSIQLRGTVSAKRNFPSAKVFWILPEGLELIGGQLSTDLSLTKGEEKQYEILVKSNSTKNLQIHFVVNETVEGDGTNLGATAQYNTVLKDFEDSEVGLLNSSERKQKSSMPRKKLKKPTKIFQ